MGGNPGRDSEPCDGEQLMNYGAFASGRAVRCTKSTSCEGISSQSAVLFGKVAPLETKSRIKCRLHACLVEARNGG